APGARPHVHSSRKGARVRRGDNPRADHRGGVLLKMKTRFTEGFGTRYPIVCAPMALVTGGRLAAAVSNAGGLGIVGGGYGGILGGEPDLRQELSHVRGQKFGVGFITWALARAPHMLEVALDHSPYCVFLSFGDPRLFAEQVRSSGAKLICQ